MLRVRGFLAAATMWCAFACGAAPAQNLDGITVPATTSADGRALALNGTGIGTQLFIKVYVVALYLEKKTTSAQTAITGDHAKRIVVTMLRDVSRRQFVEAVEKGMIRNSDSRMPLLRDRLNLLEGALPSLKKGNILDFTYVPGVGTIVQGQGRKLTIPGKDFSEALLSVWLGAKAPNGALRRDLLGG